MKAVPVMATRRGGSSGIVDIKDNGCKGTLYVQYGTVLHRYCTVQSSVICKLQKALAARRQQQQQQQVADLRYDI